MKIEIIHSNILEMTISDENINNDNFVSVFIENEEVTVPIDELYLAVKTFLDKRTLRLEHEKLMTP